MSSSLSAPPPSIQIGGGDQDTAAIAKIAMAIHQQIAAEAKLQDDVMGAGPGVKMIRKAGGPGGAPPSDSGGY